MDERKYLYLKRRKKIIKYLSCKRKVCDRCRSIEECTPIEREWIQKYKMMGSEWKPKMNIQQEELCLTQ